MDQQWWYLFDFDSTIVRTEALEELARIALADHPERDTRVREIARITDMGMEGKLPFHDSLAQRLVLLEARQEHLDKLTATLVQTLSPSFLAHRPFFEVHQDALYVISGGFREFIIPVVEKLGIGAHQVYANTFLFDDSGKIVGVDMNSPLSREGGKVQLVREMNLQGSVVMVGDGMSDAALREAGVAEKFVAYGETVERPSVLKYADGVARSFDDVLDMLCGW